MGRSQRRDVDRVVTRLAVDRDGVQPQAGLEKSPIDVERVARPRTPCRPARVDAVDADLLDLPQLGDDRRGIRAVARDHDLRRAVEHIRVVSRKRIPGRPGVDAVGLARGVAVDHEGIAETAFRAAVDHVAAVGRHALALAFQMNVSSPASPLRVSFARCRR